MGNTNQSISVHPLSEDPSAAFQELSKTHQFIKLPINHGATAPEPGHIRIVCMSDTHSEEKNFKFQIPNGDIFIHAGDFTTCGKETEVIQFNQWMQSLPHQYKIVIAGNHEFTFDKNCSINRHKKGPKGMKKLLKDCIYLEDSAVTLYGLKIYGAPWQPEFRGLPLAFTVPRGKKILSKWNLIPRNTDILVTHVPPLGHGDRTSSGARAGCVELLSTIQNRVKPSYHIFGHIHEGYGMSTNGSTKFINAATCNRYNVPEHLPIVFDIEVK